MTHRTRKTIVWLSAILVVFVFAALLWTAQYMLNYSLNPLRRTVPEGFDRAREHGPAAAQWIDSVQQNHLLRDTAIVVDGIKHHAVYMKADAPDAPTAVIVHGYHDLSQGMLHIGYLYQHDLGYNILLPDLYGHGSSTGDHVNMGWLDRLDVLRWVQLTDSLSGHKPIVLHGISMGAATVMCLSGEQLPPSVKAIVEDCGYTSVWDEFSHQLEQTFDLDEFPVLYASSALCKMRYGWTFGEASPLEMVKRCRLPMLFIHGDSDTFVPTEMVYTLHRAKPQPKQLWIAPGSKHARAYTDHPEQYTKVVESFLTKYVQ